MEGEDRYWSDLNLRVGRVFTPNTPIDQRSLFAGREEQVTKIVDVINSPGQHAILFGERGVGKTSLANVLSELLPLQPNSTANVLAPRVQCVSNDSFKSIWTRVLDQIELTRTAKTIGFGLPESRVATKTSELLGGEKITPDAIRRILTITAVNAVPIVIIDEFDRLKPEPRREFADLIKNLSDNAVGATVVLVGVADSITNLIEEHQSVTRSLIQVSMPRMLPGEIRAILRKGTKKLGMKMRADAVERVVLLAQGLPHYAHLMGKHSSRTAIEQRSLLVGIEHVNIAVRRAIADAQHSIRSAYDYAIRSPRKHNLFANILLACALAEVDDIGGFAAQSVREPLRRITSKDYDIPTYAQHLAEFSDEKRGPILHKTGKRYRFRYRFAEPLMQPFVIMEGMARGVLPDDLLAQGLPSESASKDQPADEDGDLGLFGPPAH